CPVVASTSRLRSTRSLGPKARPLASSLPSSFVARLPPEARMGDGEGVREGPPDHAARVRAGAPSPRTRCGRGAKEARGAAPNRGAPGLFALSGFEVFGEEVGAALPGVGGGRRVVRRAVVGVEAVAG